MIQSRPTTELPESSTELKTERRLFSFTVAERCYLEELTAKSRADSKSALIRDALDLYIFLWGRRRAGARVIMMHDATRDTIELSSLLRCGTEGRVKPEKESPRRNLEVKVEPSFDKELVEAVREGAAPNVTRLAWFAVSTLGAILEAEKNGRRLMEVVSGKCVPLSRSNTWLPPSAVSHSESTVRAVPSEDGRDHSETKDPIGKPIGYLARYDIEDVLTNWEGKNIAPRTRWRLTTLDSLLSRNVHKVSHIMMRNLLSMNEYYIAVSSATPDSIRDLEVGITSALAPRIKWDLFPEEQQRELLERLELERFAEVKKAHTANPESPKASPAWLLVLGHDFSPSADGVRTTTKDYESMRRIFRMNPSWIRERVTSPGAGKHLISEDGSEPDDKTGFILRYTTRQGSPGERLRDSIANEAIQMDRAAVDAQIEELRTCELVCLLGYADKLADESAKKSDMRFSKASPPFSQRDPVARTQNRGAAAR